MKLGIKTIAIRAGVSPATVSLSLKDDPRVADKTKAKIKALAKECGYIPNNFGCALQSNKSSLIGLLSPMIDKSYFNEILHGAGELACEKNYGLLVATPSGGYKNEVSQLEVFMEKGVDGIIISSCSSKTFKTLMNINSHKIPLVFNTNSLFNNDIFPIVKNDDIKTGTIAAEHMVALGHKKLIFCFTNSLKNERYAGALQYCMNNAIHDFKCVETENELYELLKTDQRPTGIIADNDDIAVTVMNIILQTGLRIPEDISVIGVDDSLIASLPAYQLTTIAPQKKNIGRLSFEMIIDIIAGLPRESIYLEPKLIIRQTTAIVRKY